MRNLRAETERRPLAPGRMNANPKDFSEGVFRRSLGPHGCFIYSDRRFWPSFHRSTTATVKSVFRFAFVRGEFDPIFKTNENRSKDTFTGPSSCSYDSGLGFDRRFHFHCHGRTGWHRFSLCLIDAERIGSHIIWDSIPLLFRMDRLYSHSLTPMFPINDLGWNLEQESRVKWMMGEIKTKWTYSKWR